MKNFIKRITLIVLLITLFFGIYIPWLYKDYLIELEQIKKELIIDENAFTIEAIRIKTNKDKPIMIFGLTKPFILEYKDLEKEIY